MYVYIDRPSGIPQRPDSTVCVICGKVCRSAGLHLDWKGIWLSTKTVFLMKIRLTLLRLWLLCVMSVIVLVNHLPAFRATWVHMRSYLMRNMKLETEIICGDAAIIMYVHAFSWSGVYIYIYVQFNIVSGGKCCLVVPGVAVPPWATETVLSPLVGGWWGQGIARAFSRTMKKICMWELAYQSGSMTGWSIDWLINFNGMSIALGYFMPQTLRTEFIIRSNLHFCLVVFEVFYLFIYSWIQSSKNNWYVWSMNVWSMNVWSINRTLL